MPEETEERARTLCRRGWDIPAIAAELGHPEESVELACASLRTPNPSRTRATLNVTLETHDFVHSQRRNGEPVWLATERLLTELVMLRAEVLGLRARVGAATPSA